MKTKRVTPILVAVAAIVLLLLAGVCIRASHITPRILGDGNAPQATVTGFFDALCDRDYDACAEYVSGYSTIGLDAQPDNESERMVYNALQESYTYQLIGDITIDADGTFQRVLITAFDVDSLSNDISEQFMPELESIMSTTSDYSSLFDKDGQYSEILIDQTLSNIITRLIAAPEQYYVTADIAVELEFVDGEWKLILSDELVSILTGSIGEV